MLRKRSALRHRDRRWLVSALEPRLMLAGDAGSTVLEAVAETATTAQSSAATKTTNGVIVFVDAAAADVVSVENALTEGATLVLLRPDADGVAQIRAHLSTLRSVQEVHIVSHGSAGELQLGSTVLSAETLSTHTANLRGWAETLAPGADILLYGCDVASTSAGKELVRDLSKLCQADVAASDDRTSNNTRRGDWELEFKVGNIESELALTHDAMAAYRGYLGIEIRAAGSMGDELLQVQIGDQVVSTLNISNTGVFQRQFQSYFVNVDGVDVDQIRLNFINDAYDPSQGIDRNVGIDWIRVDGVQYETESPTVYSTGTWEAATGIVPGFKGAEVLYANGYFAFGGNTGSGSTLRIFASGSVGSEQMKLLIDGQEVATYNNVPQVGAVYTYQADQTLSANQIRVAFTNDFYQDNIDRNLSVDRIEIDGVTYQTEAPSTFSTGGYAPGLGIISGNLQEDTLYGNGYFQYASGSVGNVGQIGLAETQVTVNENAGTVSIGLRRTGGTSGSAQVFYQTQDASAISGVDYVGTASGVVNFADGQQFGSITLNLLDNAFVDGEKNFNLSLFRVDGAVQGEPRTANITIVDNESGDGLIGYWDLNETVLNGTAIDRSGLGNNGQGTNFASPTGPSSDTPDTNFNNPGSYRFDGVNDFINVPENESLRLTEGTYSQSVWIKPTSYDNNYRGVIGYQLGTSVGTRYPFIYVRNDEITVGFGTGGNTWKGVVADKSITINAWNHVAVTFDGTTMTLYVNGEVVGTNSNFGGSKPPTNFAQLTIGRINNQFIGQIDEVRMYDRAINGAEVQSLIAGATLPPPNVVGFFTTSVVTGGLVEPTTIERLPDGRLLVAERAGTIRLVNTDGTLSSTVFLDIRDIVNRVGEDRGIMSIAIPPDFAQTRQIYVAYTYDPPEVQGRVGAAGPDGDGARVARVSRFTVNASWTAADRNTEVVIVGKNSTYENIGQPNRRPLLNDPQSGLDANGNYINDFIASDELSHTIGDMEFGQDGALYISVGDGGSYGRVDPINLRALNLNSLNGKILRVDRVTGLGLSDNPFFDGDPNSNASRIYSYGLRNPFRFAIHPTSGEVFIADVGWLNWEEINTGRGKNFGWPAYEGLGLTGGDRGSYSSLPATQAFLNSGAVVTPPIWTRSHAAGARAIIMGDFVQGGDYPASLQGAFLFTDIGDRILRAGRLDANGQLIDVVPVSSTLGFITDIMRMPDGSLYYTDLVAGTIGKLIFNG